MFNFMYNFICRCRKTQPTFNKANGTVFLEYCKKGDLQNIEKNLTYFNSEFLDMAVIDSIKSGNNEVVKFLVGKISGKMNLNSFLKHAVISNNFTLTEYFLQKGALPIYGLRVSNSANLTKLLFRYEQKSEIIN